MGGPATSAYPEFALALWSVRVAVSVGGPLWLPLVPLLRALRIGRVLLIRVEGFPGRSVSLSRKKVSQAPLMPRVAALPLHKPASLIGSLFVDILIAAPTKRIVSLSRILDPVSLTLIMYADLPSDGVNLKFPRSILMAMSSLLPLTMLLLCHLRTGQLTLR